MIAPYFEILVRVNADVGELKNQVPGIFADCIHIAPCDWNFSCHRISADGFFHYSPKFDVSKRSDKHISLKQQDIIS